MLLRMGGWLGGFGLVTCGFRFLFGCSVVIGLIIFGGVWLNAFSRMAAPMVPFRSRLSPPLGGVRPAPSGDAQGCKSQFFVLKNTS